MKRAYSIVYLTIFLYTPTIAQQTISYPLDNHGRIQAEKYPDSIAISYTYDAVGNIKTKTIENPCYDRPKPVISIAGSQTLCKGDSVMLTVLSTLPSSWSTGDSSKSIFVKSNGNYIVTTKGTLNCYKASNPITIKVTPIDIAINGRNDVAPRSSHPYQVQYTKGSIYLWLADNGDIDTGNGTSNVIVRWNDTDTSGLLKVIEITSLGCFGDTTYFPTIIGAPYMDVNPPLLQYNSNIGTKAAWVTSNDNWTVTSNQPWITVSKSGSAGNDTVYATVTKNYSATARSASLTFTADTIIEMVIISQEAGDPVSEHIPTEIPISIYPNPTRGHCTISYGSTEGLKKVQIHNMIGAKIKTVHSITKETQLDLSQLPKGLYIIEIMTERGIQTFKLLIE